MIGPSPVPLEMALGETVIDGKMAIVLQVASPIGQFVFFLDAGMARNIGKAMADLGLRAETGLVIPNGAHVS